jgi:trimethylamine--corrinoid protein Co-methyltransferase
VDLPLELVGRLSAAESMVLGDELIGFMRAFMRPLPVDVEALALDEIAAVGPGGTHLGRDYTRKHFRRFWRPRVFDHSVHDRWAANGTHTLRERLRERTEALLAQETEPVIDAAQRGALDRLLEDAVRVYP